MTQGLFAGLDSEGNLRHIGEVAAGAACGLRCYTCNAPLIAKKGMVNTWHLAHEAGQENPQCLVGAINMLRYCAMRMLAQWDSWGLPAPEYRYRGVAGKIHSVSWQMADLKPVSCDPDAPSTKPMAVYDFGDLGFQVHLYVAVGREPVDHADRSAACLVYHIAHVPDIDQMLTEERANAFIQANGAFVWQHFPDFDGRHQRLRDQVSKEREDELRRLQQERARLAGQRWARIRNAGMPSVAASGPITSNERRQEHVEAPHSAQSSPTAPAPRQGREDGLPEPWKGLQQHQRSFMYWSLNDGADWLMLCLDDNRRALVPWPDGEEGWEESLPASVGLFDESMQVIVVKDVGSAISYLNERAKAVFTLSYPLDPKELKRLNAPA